MPSNTSPAVTPAPIAASPKWNCSGFEFPLVVAGGILWTLMRANRSSEALGLAAARCAAIRSAGVGAVLLGTRGALDIFAKPPLNVAAVPITTSDLSGRLYTAAGIRLAAIAWVVVVPGSVLLDGLAAIGLSSGLAHTGGAAIASATVTAAVVVVVSRMLPPLVRGSIRLGPQTYGRRRPSTSGDFPMLAGDRAYLGVINPAVPVCDDRGPAVHVECSHDRRTLMTDRVLSDATSRSAIPALRRPRRSAPARPARGQSGRPGSPAPEVDARAAPGGARRALLLCPTICPAGPAPRACSSTSARHRAFSSSASAEHKRLPHDSRSPATTRPRRPTRPRRVGKRFLRRRALRQPHPIDGAPRAASSDRPRSV